jgi:CheY-like chemotaxis protein
MKLRTQVLLGYIVVFALMIIVAGVTHQGTSALIENQQLVEETHEAKTKARYLMRLLVDMETGVRGYALTGKDELLEPFESAKPLCDSTIAELKTAKADSPQQLARVKEIETIAIRWQKEVAAPVLQARRTMNPGAGEEHLHDIVALVERENSRLLMRSLRDTVTKFVDVEAGLLQQQKDASVHSATQCIWIVIASTIAAIGLGIVAMTLVTRAIMRQVGGEPAAIAAITGEIAQGNLDVAFEDGENAATGIRASVGSMLAALRENRTHTQQQDWLKTGIARLNEVMSGDPEIDSLATNVISEIATYLDAQVGAFYILQEEARPVLTLTGSYAFTKRKNLANAFYLGESLVGQAALEKQPILLKNVPEDYVCITSALGERVPRFICIMPFMYEGNVRGVLELGTLHEMPDQHLEYLKQAMPALAVAVESAQGRTALAKSLAESQQLSEELQAQQEELRIANEELEQQTQRLEESEERLKAQQEELEVTNEELEEKNDLLDRQKRDVEAARKDIEKKAAELALASKYKSEFLANMSHELRTPLNSLLLLAQGLAQNKTGNMSEEQVESARIIHGSGSDLLNLINEILDLSKIEAGKMDLKIEAVRLESVANSLQDSFGHMADAKGLAFAVEIRPEAPREIQADRKRMEQIIRNLVSNALKFTESGSVSITIGKADSTANLSRSGLATSSALAIEVKDTGIGIDPAQQDLIFEAFQQADGGTSRKYGGTGLGLSISRELANLLGGEIQLLSTPGKGSTFTLYMPLELKPKGKDSAKDTGVITVSRNAHAEQPVAAKSAAPHPEIEDDRETVVAGDKTILIIEDDPRFATTLREKCHGKGFKCLTAPSGETGLELAVNYLPAAVILDIRLPGMDGWAVLNELKENTATRHIPVHVISVEESSLKAIRSGAIGHAVKPVDQEHLEEVFRKFEQAVPGSPRRVLVVEDNPEIRKNTVALIRSDDITVDEAESGKQAIQALRDNHYDCMVLDLNLPDADGGSLLKVMEREGLALPPVIVHTARELTEDEEFELREHADSIVIKDVRSQERLLDEVSLFLHRVVSEMPEKARQIIRDLHDTDALLRDKTVLIVDDDMRTTFALSHLLSERGMKTLKAENGEKALRRLQENPGVDLVLMDIMMPVMDGYETMSRIRAQEPLRKLPIIVLTAKAMDEDREKCIRAGANDYLPKPVNPDRLLSMMRVWLYR